MERVTVEQNGERFVLEVPDGTTDDQIRAFINQQQGGGTGGATQMLTPPADAMQNIAAQATIAGLRPAGAFAATQVGDLAKLAQIAGQVTPKIAGEFLSTPIQSAKNLAGAYFEGHPWAQKAANVPLKSVPGALVRGLGTALAAPESAFLMPYNMAAYEQAKIRENPNAPGLQYNPYAMSLRGEAATQGRAGQGNIMRAVSNMPYGNVTAEERALLDEDRRINAAVRRKALEKVMGPVAPGSF